MCLDYTVLLKLEKERGREREGERDKEREREGKWFLNWNKLEVSLLSIKYLNSKPKLFYL